MCVNYIDPIISNQSINFQFRLLAIFKSFATPELSQVNTARSKAYIWRDLFGCTLLLNYIYQNQRKQNNNCNCNVNQLIFKKIVLYHLHAGIQQHNASSMWKFDFCSTDNTGKIGKLKEKTRLMMKFWLSLYFGSRIQDLKSLKKCL